ncbi:MAG TPA: carboxypeptidase regulatory-like domain-containing protein [Gemmatimonadaceae bacterium]|nr:carboxypeptidase regulatory-like domain-containing protein [Gemmatimonadaceae bacterium]
MTLKRRLAVFSAIALLGAVPLSSVAGQGVTTGAIGGLVTDSAGNPLGQVQIQIVQRQTGYTVGGLSRDNGRYLIPALEAGGPYSVTARRIGFQPQTRDNVIVSLSQTTQVDFRLGQQAAQIAGVTVVATTSDFSSSRQGVETTLSDSMLQRIPTLSRDIVDFVKISPQVVRPLDGGPSAGGTYNRFNNFTIDGASQNDRFGLGSSGGTPGGATGGRLISIDAVKEMQVLLSPSDVRHGNFSGMLLNAVTKSGTNDFSGSAFFAYRDSKFGANEPVIRNSELEVQQFGFTFGGPIIKNKLHFFIAPEFQQRSQPASGPFVGQTSNEAGIVASDSIEAVRQALASRFDVGSSGRVNNENPLTNLFARLDYQLSENHRLVLRQLMNTAESDAFSRNATSFNTAVGVQSSGFRLSSNAFTTKNTNNSSVVQLYSYFSGGKSNEFILGYNTVKDERIVPVVAPEISIGVVPLGAPPAQQTSPTASITVGTEQFSPGNLLDQKILELQNNFTFPWNEHTFTFGARYENTDIFNNFAQQAFGAYKFATIAALRNNTPLNYAFAYSNGGPIAAEFNVGQYSVYAQDQWNLTDRLSLTYGLRVDVPQFGDAPVANDTIAARFTAAGITDVRTDVKPETQILWSPRIGLNFDPTGDRKNQIRAVVGIFTGPPPLIMIGNAYANTGLGLVRLLCSGTGQVPAFTTDVDQLPRSCAGQPAPLPGQAGTAGINITDPNFKYPQNFTGSLGFDRQLPWGTIFTFEGLYRKAINGVLVVDRNIRDPLQRSTGGPITDRTGRWLYWADSMSVTPGARRVVTTIGRPAVAFSEGVIEVTNQSKDYNWSVSGQLRKSFGGDLDLMTSYTYLESKDVQSLTSDRAISNWRNGMQPFESITDPPLADSYFDRPHRVVASGNYTLPWKSWTTNLSLYYEGTSGSVLTYTANGDLNGDGFNGNDPIYIPTGPTDPNIAFGTLVGGVFVPNAAMAQDFDNFVSENSCLDEQRGQIMKRNSCRGPWQNRMDFSIRQSLPAVRGQRLAVQLDILNFLNFLNKDWGQWSLPTLSQNFPQQQALILRARTVGSLTQSVNGFEFDSRLRTNTDPTATSAGAFIKRASSEANFYRMLLTLRYSF